MSDEMEIQKYTIGGDDPIKDKDGKWVLFEDAAQKFNDLEIQRKSAADVTGLAHKETTQARGHNETLMALLRQARRSESACRALGARWTAESTSALRGTPT